MEIFYASGDPVRFTPNRPGDEDAADQMTMVVNHVVNVQNPGFQIFEDWFKSALLSKVAGRPHDGSLSEFQVETSRGILPILISLRSFTLCACRPPGPAA